MNIDVGTLNFLDGSTPDGDGIYWMVADYEGWDSPTFKQPLDSLVGRSGATKAPSYLDTRTVTLKGLVKAPTKNLADFARNEMLDVLYGSMNEPVNVVFHEDDVDRFVSAYLATDPKIARLGSHFTFQMNLVAIDPFRYTVATNSQALSAGANVLVNGGNRPTFLRMVTGASAGDLVVTNMTASGNPSLKADGVPAGSTINMKDFTVKDSGGVNRYDTIDSSQTTWWTLLPGSNTINYSGPDVTAYWNDAWI